MKPQAYPLSWPVTQKRTAFRTESRFKRPGTNMRSRRHSITEARQLLSDELDRLGARGVTLSTNLELNLNGDPRGTQGQPYDPGAAVYFELNGKPHVLACDKWQHVECNIYAIAKHIDSMRGQDRWGVGTQEQAFTGYLALEAQTQQKWFEILECLENAPPQTVEQHRKVLLKAYHPDGSAPNSEKLHQVSEAYRIYKELHP